MHRCHDTTTPVPVRQLTVLDAHATTRCVHAGAFRTPHPREAVRGSGSWPTVCRPPPAAQATRRSRSSRSTPRAPATSSSSPSPAELTRTPWASVGYVRATRTSLPRRVRIGGAGRLAPRAPRTVRTGYAYQPRAYRTYCVPWHPTCCTRTVRCLAPQVSGDFALEWAEKIAEGDDGALEG